MTQLILSCYLSAHLHKLLSSSSLLGQSFLSWWYKRQTATSMLSGGRKLDPDRSLHILPPPPCLSASLSLSLSNPSLSLYLSFSLSLSLSLSLSVCLCPLLAPSVAVPFSLPLSVRCKLTGQVLSNKSFDAGRQTTGMDFDEL